MTHTLVFEEKLQNNCKEERRHVSKSSIVQEEKNTRSLKMTTYVNDTHFGVSRDVTKNCEEEKKRLH
jgi:hypothetical protein